MGQRHTYNLTATFIHINYLTQVTPHHHAKQQVKNFKSPSTAPNGGRGNPPPPAKSAELIFKLQQRLRNARVVYSSATIATRSVRARPTDHDNHPHPNHAHIFSPTTLIHHHTTTPPHHHHHSPNHLECLARLGLWGPGTAFSNSTEFAEAMRGGGLPALELLALNLKSEGKYLTRCLGFKVRPSLVGEIGHCVCVSITRVETNASLSRTT